MDRMRIEVELVGPLRSAELRRVMQQGELAMAVPWRTLLRSASGWFRRGSSGACRRWPVIDRNRLLPDECVRQRVGFLGQRPA